MSDIFISYAREDKRHAEALARTFRAEGWSVWWDDTLRAGTVFDDAIERELGAARCVVVLEAVVPPLSLRQIHAINFSGSTPGDISVSLQQLIADVATVLRDHRVQPSSPQLRRARSAAMLERASLEFLPLVLTLIAVLQGFSAATPGGYDLMVRQYKYLVAFVLVRSSVASYMMRQMRP